MIICSNYVNGKLKEKKHKINNDLIVKTVLLNIFYPNKYNLTKDNLYQQKMKSFFIKSMVKMATNALLF